MGALEMEDDPPAPMPPVRAFDDGLAERIARGGGTVWEAQQVAGMMAWMRRYESALHWIAVHAEGEAAMLACRVLAGDWDGQEQ